MNVSIPAGNARLLPAVSVQVGLPVKMYPDITVPAFHAAAELQWQNGITIFAGDLSFSKTVSLFKNPSFTLSMNPLSLLSVPDSGLGAAFTGNGAGRKPFAAALIIPLGRLFGRTASIQCAGDAAGTYTALLRVPFEAAGIKGVYAISVCSYKLENTVCDNSVNGSWFLNAPVFTDNGQGGSAFFKDRYAGVLQEISVQIRRFRAYGLFGFSESPFGGISCWGRVLGRADIGSASFSGGFYCGDFNIIGAGGNLVRNTIQGFINPVVFMHVGGDKSGLLRFAGKFAVNGRNSGGINSCFLLDGKASAGTEFVFNSFSVRVVAVWTDFPLYGTAVDAASRGSEYMSGTLSATVRVVGQNGKISDRFVYNAFRSSAGVRYYPAKGSASEKTHITCSFSTEPDVRGREFVMSFLPSVLFSSEISIGGGQYKNTKSDISFTWNIRSGAVSIRGTVGLSFSF